MSSDYSPVLSGEQITATGQWIADTQCADGFIPWFFGGPGDVWDHIEAAMGLTIAGFHDHAKRAYLWLASHQRADGSWAAAFSPNFERAGSDHQVVYVATDESVNSNFCAYIAAGVLHHVLATGDTDFLHTMFTHVESAIDRVQRMALEDGRIGWASDYTTGATFVESLVTGASSTVHSYECALRLARMMGISKPEWEQSYQRQLSALRAFLSSDTQPQDAVTFLAKDEFSMDWYYPVMCGVVTGDQAQQRFAAGEASFVRSAFGINCVDHKPWATGAESSEYAMALTRHGQPERARKVLANIAHLRDDSGAYWTGFVYQDHKRWPVELSTWTAGAVLLAADALDQHTAASTLFTASQVDEECQG